MLPPVTLNLVLAAVLGAVLAVLLVRRPRPPYWPDLIFLPIAALLYVFGDALAANPFSSVAATLRDDLRYTGAYLGTAALLALALRLARHDGLQRIPKDLVLVPWYVFAASVSLLLTNRWHQLYLVPDGAGGTSAGPLWMPVFRVYVALWLPATACHAYLALRGRHLATRRSATFLLGGMLLLLAPTLWAVFVGSPGFDPVLVGITLTGTWMALGAYRANLFHLDGGGLARAVEGALDPVVVAQGDGRLLYLNAAANQLLGNTGADSDLFRLLTDRFRAPAGAEHRPGWLRDHLGSPPAPDQEQTLPALFVTRDDPPRWFSFHPLKLAARPGRPELLALRLHDYTAEREQRLRLQQSEERFRSLLEQAPLGLLACDHRGVVYLVNQRLLDLFDTPEDLAVGSNLLESPSIHELGVDDSVTRALGEGRSSIAECSRRNAAGSELELRVHLQPLRSGDSGPALLLLIEDVTQLRHAERERRAFERRLLETQKLEGLGVLAGGIAHDFSNVLTAVKGHAQLGIRRSDDGQPAGEHFTTILRIADQAAGLVGQILAYSGRATARRLALNLDELVSGMEPLLSSVVARQVPLQIEVEPNLPPVVADDGQLRQAFMNLLTNAVEAQRDRPGSVRITVGRGNPAEQPPDGLVLDAGALYRPHVFLRVEDQGCGMDAATQARIFEPFFSTRGAGRGLGLAATIGIVRAHGGALALVSRPGRGTRVTVLLPVHGNDLDIARGGPPILVVDTDASLRSLARLALEGAGRSVLTASTPEMARLTIESQTSLGAIVLDNQYESIDLLAAIRSRRPDLPVILTGDRRHADPQRLGGSTLLLPKPFTVSELVEKVERLCHRGPTGTMDTSPDEPATSRSRWVPS
jgi:PAS domain S-box-containing protein